MTFKYLLATVVVAATTVAAAPQTQAPAPPATEVYLASLAAGTPDQGIGPWINISNSPGYDNQPSFLTDSSGILFSSNRDGKQMDIYRYDITARKVSQVTSTPEGEYSPTVTPDRRTFSVIRTEADTTQRLWRFDLNGSNPRLVLENVKPVDYHAWIDETRLALFILGSGGSPATLQLADTRTGLAAVAVTGIGRSILVRPGKGTVSYLAMTETPRVLKELDPKTGASTTLIAPVQGSQDCAWLPDGRLLMASGPTISVWTPGSTTWTAFAHLNVLPTGAETPPVTSITRMAVSPDGKWLAFVAEPVVR